MFFYVESINIKILDQVTNLELTKKWITNVFWFNFVVKKKRFGSINDCKCHLLEVELK